MWFGGGLSVGYATLLILSVLVTRQVNTEIQVMNKTQDNFQELVRTNPCLDEFSRVDDALVSDKISHLDHMISKLYIYTWVFFGIVWLPLSTPIMYCIVYRMFKSHVQLRNDTSLRQVDQNLADSHHTETPTSSLQSRASYRRLE